jgi:acyl carrier protein
MTEEQIYLRLHEIFRSVFDDDTITINGETSAADIPEWDSFNHINIIVATEAKFGFKFSSAEIVSLANVGEFVALIRSKL